MTKSKIAALVATLALGALGVGCSTAVVNENMNKPANTTAPANVSKPANMAPANTNTSAKPPVNSNMKMPPPPPPKASATKKP
jgi:PBP1b-binding outer membrane lipoprotein LpoB